MKCICKYIKSDDMRPISDAMDTLFNQLLENRYKINFNQRGYNPEQNCPEHKWKSGGINKKVAVIFCENCGKIKTIKL